MIKREVSNILEVLDMASDDDAKEAVCQWLHSHDLNLDLIEERVNEIGDEDGESEEAEGRPE